MYCATTQHPSVRLRRSFWKCIVSHITPCVTWVCACLVTLVALRVGDIGRNAGLLALTSNWMLGPALPAVPDSRFTSARIGWPAPKFVTYCFHLGTMNSRDCSLKQRCFLHFCWFQLLEWYHIIATLMIGLRVESRHCIHMWWYILCLCWMYCDRRCVSERFARKKSAGLHRPIKCIQFGKETITIFVGRICISFRLLFG
jgi:hypothetical protein